MWNHGAVDATADILAAVRVGEPFAEFSSATDPRAGAIASAPRATASVRIVLDGSCRVVPFPRTPGTPGTPGSFAPFVLEAGEMALFGPGVAHGVCAVDAEARSLHGGYLIGRRQPHPVLRGLPDVSRIPMRAGCPLEFQTLVAMLGDELDRRAPGSTELTPSLADAVLTYTLRAWLRHRAQDGTWSTPNADAVLAPALQAMHERMAHPWSVAELASVSGLSRAAFARRFTASVGRPPLAHLTDLRLSMAARLLRQTDDSIARIAEAVGYGSQIALTRAFRREEGVTPGYYRSLRKTSASR
jgi:AraC-like DNA-binding protein